MTRSWRKQQTAPMATAAAAAAVLVVRLRMAERMLWYQWVWSTVWVVVGVVCFHEKC